MHASAGILFNHESPRRGYEFVTRKISFGVAKIAAGKADRLALGNLEARRDWGHAREYVEAMWSMLQQEQPDDYVIATGVVHSVEDFARLAFACVGLDYRDHVVTDERFRRPAEVDFLMGDASKARAALGWNPATTFEQLVAEMVAADCEAMGARAPVTAGSRHP
jgi:GDPmannose 4,6-dehydratase